MQTNMHIVNNLSVFHGGSTTFLLDRFSSNDKNIFYVLSSLKKFKTETLESKVFISETQREKFLRCQITLFKAARIVRSSDSVTIYVHGVFNPIALLKAILITRQRSLITIIPHGALSDQCMKYGKTKKRLYLTFLKACGLGRTFQVTSTIEATSVKKYFGSNVAITSCSFNLASFKEFTKTVTNNFDTKGPLKLGYIGRYAQVKNTHLFYQLLTIFSDLQLYTLGVKKSDTAKYFCETPRLTVIEPTFDLYKKKDFYNQIDCTVLPSESENFGMVVLESLICARPVICTRNSPWADFADMPGIFIIQPNFQDLCSAVKKVKSYLENTSFDERVNDFHIILNAYAAQQETNR